MQTDADLKREKLKKTGVIMTLFDAKIKVLFVPG
jgi:hypothetical protein